VRDQCQLRASALTFYTLLSSVPVMAMAFGIAKGFGLEQLLQEGVIQALYLRNSSVKTPLLAAVIRRGIGAATRAGAARFVSTLAARAPREALASPDVAAPLLSALWSGAKAERGVGVRKALRAMVRPVKDVAILIEEATQEACACG
jgi:uncharacterized BrkB/YihY/UPF0761 family membrane protein